MRNLERSLAALARDAAVKVAGQETIQLSKGVNPIAAPLLDTRLSDGAEVEMEVIPMGVNGNEISNALRSTSALVVDEAMLEKVLGVLQCPIFKLELFPEILLIAMNPRLTFCKIVAKI